MEKKIICFDLDNTLCITKKNYYKKSKPLKKKISFVNSLYKKGHIIIIFTSRYMGRSNQKVSLAKKKLYKFTISQLSKWDLKYNKLIFGKPSYDIFIDDKNINFNKNWMNELKNKIKLND
jgi:hypothetical protein